MRRRIVIGIVPSAAALAACGQAVGGSGGPATKSEYVVAPLLGDLNALVTSINRGAVMAEFLKKETGVNVKTFAPGDYAGTQIGLRDGTIDFAFLPAALFLKAQDESGAQALYRTTRPAANNAPAPGFSSIIAVRADSGISTLKDLAGKLIGAGDPSDAARWVAPAGHLKKNGVDPNKDARVQFRNSGADALVRLLTKNADAAFAARHDLEHADVIKADADAVKNTKILATVDNVPLEVVAVRRGVDAKVVDKFKTAFKSLGDTAKATYTKDGKTEPILAQWGITGLTETKDADFAALREAAKSIGLKLK